MYHDQKPSLLNWIKFPATLSAAKTGAGDRATIDSNTINPSAEYNRTVIRLFSSS
jgi:hypothetical protein